MRLSLSLSLLVFMVNATSFGAGTVPADEAALPPGAQALCVVSDDRIRESSGIAMSRRQPDAVWLHNDSGDAARLFLVGLDGHTRGVVRLPHVGKPLDWEDMCSFTVNGMPWLMIGDVGDNARNRSLAADDKGRSRAKTWRVSEKNLHWISMLGGWPGAYLAQRRYRHKTAKAGFHELN